ncbi:MAG: response regulator [Desulfosporosinus sp.]|nr:response regulator [Desulfosporosinus sp.]
MKRILFVDDEVQILKSLTRLFIDTEYDVLTAESGEAALQVLENEEINLVVSDMRMPFMDGYQLLCKVKELYPKILRVVLSGYADQKIVLKALQQNIAKLYMFKPWNNELLLKLVEQIFETEDLLSNSDLLLLINNFAELPTLKSSYQRVIGMIEEDAEITEIAREIERDLSISTKVLHIANSAFYGVKTGSVKQAVTYLGLQNIRSLILTTSIMESMGVSGMGMDFAEELWNHAFLTNKVLVFIFEKCLQKKVPEVASSAGLLHNIGVVFMLQSFSKNYIDFRNKAVKEGFDFIELEKAQFKATHQETGGYLLKWWDLPFPIVEAALYHHNPLDERIVNSELVIGVHIAQKYAWDMMKVAQLTRFFPETFVKIGLKQSEFEEKLSTVTWK